MKKLLRKDLERKRNRHQCDQPHKAINTVACLAKVNITPFTSLSKVSNIPRIFICSPIKIRYLQRQGSLFVIVRFFYIEIYCSLCGCNEKQNEEGRILCIYKEWGNMIPPRYDCKLNIEW